MASTWGVLLASAKEELLAPETVTAFINLNSRPVLSYSLNAFEHCPDVDHVVVVAPKEKLEQVQAQVQMFGCQKVRKIVPGGATYHSSLMNGLKYVEDTAKTIVIHEVSRPLVHSKDLTDVIKASRRNGCAALAHSVTGRTVIEGKNHVVDKEIDGKKLMVMGTPQAFDYEKLQKAVGTARKRKKSLRETIDAMPGSRVPIKLVVSDAYPEKISSADDLYRLEGILKATAAAF